MGMDSVSVRIRLASPEDIRGWSSGEVTNADFLKDSPEHPHPDGLFSERIFGPLTDDRARRQRLGHIELAVPVVHAWLLHARPSPLALLLGLEGSALRRVADCQDFLVLAAGTSGLKVGSVLSHAQFCDERQRPGFEADTGGRALKKLLQQLNLDELARDLRDQLDALRQEEQPSKRRYRRLSARLKVVEDLRGSGNRPEWLVLECLPVLPPDLRPVRELTRSGLRVASDLNCFYQHILQSNDRLRRALARKMPEAIVLQEMRTLQKRVEALLDNAHCRPALTGTSGQPLKSLTDLIAGKQGRFRQNLLGKRVDYSARAAIVCGPGLKLHQCGLPRPIALELFQPILLGRFAGRFRDRHGLAWGSAVLAAGMLLKGRHDMVRRIFRETLAEATTLRQALDELDDKAVLIEELLREEMGKRLVLLNRAPSLHRMNVQAFEPVLCEGKAIQVSPLVCAAFNADFDGDTMAVHLPLSNEAQVEAALLLRPVNNLLSPANGNPLVPSNEIILGCAYLTADLEPDRPPRGLFAGMDEVLLAYDLGKVAVHDRITLRLPAGRLVTTVGRVLFNQALGPGLPFYDRFMTRQELAAVISDSIERLGREETATLLDRIKELGFRAVTRSGLSFLLDDLKEPSNKETVLQATQQEVHKVRQLFGFGKISEQERYGRCVALWEKAQEKITERLIDEMAQDNRDGLPYLNPIYLMAHAGARSKWEQVRQLAALRGLMARPSKTRPTIEQPITSSLRQGLSALEYFVSCHGARKAGADKDALPDSGYLTRKLIEVAHHVVVSMHDCGTTTWRRSMSLDEHSLGRVLFEGVCSSTGEVMQGKNTLLTADSLRHLCQRGISAVKLRGPVDCGAPRGICQLCYGTDLSTGHLVEIGTAVGVIAAQSIGEPGTQLALRTKHTGGAVTGQDMVSGLERVVGLFEARPPKLRAVLAEIGGEVEVCERANGRFLLIRSVCGLYGPYPVLHKLLVETGATVNEGSPLTEGDPDLHDMLRICGVEAVQSHLLRELQAVYRGNGVAIDDKHFEIIIARMLSRWQVHLAGDTELVPGQVVDRSVFRAANQKLKERVKIVEAGASRFQPGTLVEQKLFEQERQALQSARQAPPTAVAPTPATCNTMLTGISKLATQAESFLSAASFQQTSKVLLEAALAGKSDSLAGLKENVMLGRLIPAGTGFRLLPTEENASASLTAEPPAVQEALASRPDD
jgi:DNA-directed RNA polymerase subunit beta'